MRIIHLALKDLSQIFRDKKSLLFLVAMPIIFTLFMGFAYKSGGDKGASQDNRIPLGWVNNDTNGLLSGQLFALLARSDSVRLVEITSAAANDSVRKGKVAGALVVAAGFSEQAQAGNVPQLTLIADTATPQGQSLFQILRAPVTQVMSSAEIARLSAETIGSPDEFQPSFTAAGPAGAATHVC
jgi:ABC-type Na+ efflux pump permease subunit